MGGGLPNAEGEIMICPICGQGNLKAGTTTFAADADAAVVVVRNVPADVCDVCGEAFIDDTIAEELEGLVMEAKQAGTESIVRHYQPLAS
jgi:YgiT-type zinc finger domain-containing protein